MIADIFYILLGLAALVVGGDLLVRGAVGLARAAGISALLVSLTVIAFGTSAPELVVAVASMIEKEPGIAIGNIVGSSLANILIVLGLPAIVYPIRTRVEGLKRHAIVLLIAMAAFALVAYGWGRLDTASGALLFAGILTYVLFLALMARRTRGRDPVIDEVAEYSDGGSQQFGATALYLIAGLIGLPIGAHFLITHGASLADAIGIRAEFIGLSIISVGTCLPELATVFAAALHKKSDVAVGNVVGSNIFNMFAVAGAAGLAGAAPFSAETRSLEIPAMLIAAVALAAYILFQRDIGRFSGLVFIIAYGALMAGVGAISFGS
jgi:cation:H+ antiporter